MKCVICKNGTTTKGKVIKTLQRNGAVIVFKNVPAQICNNCGHQYFDSDTVKLMLKKAEESLKKGSELEVLKLQTT